MSANTIVEMTSLVTKRRIPLALPRRLSIEAPTFVCLTGNNTSQKIMGCYRIFRLAQCWSIFCPVSDPDYQQAKGTKAVVFINIYDQKQPEVYRLWSLAEYKQHNIL